MLSIVIVYALHSAFVVILFWYIWRILSSFRRSKAFNAEHAVYCQSVLSPVCRSYAYLVICYVFISVIVILAHYQRVGVGMDLRLSILGAPLLLLTIGTRGSKIYEIAAEGILLQNRTYAWQEVGYVQVIMLDTNPANITYLIKMTLAQRPDRVWTGTASEETKNLLIALCDKHKVIVQDGDRERGMRYA